MFRFFPKLYTRVWSQEEGQDLLEYAMLIALLALVVVVVLALVGGGLAALYQTIVDAWP